MLIATMSIHHSGRACLGNAYVDEALCAGSDAGSKKAACDCNNDSGNLGIVCTCV